ncbi:hypothetical protein ACA910_010243 [Epithemia clementina (nom. ined.)]
MKNKSPFSAAWEFLLLALLLLPYSPAEAYNIAGQGQSKLKVYLPASLNINGSYDHREALFGQPPYGGSVSGALYFANSTFCDPLEYKQYSDTAWTMNNTVGPSRMAYYPFNPFNANVQGPIVLMVRRGDCHFVQKVRNAQHMGAAAVLIADNVCLCYDTNCTSDPGASCELVEPTMVDDGSGSDVKIPSFLIFKKDADAFQKYMTEQNRTMRVELSFPPPPGIWNDVTIYEPMSPPPMEQNEKNNNNNNNNNNGGGGNDSDEWVTDIDEWVTDIDEWVTDIDMLPPLSLAYWMSPADAMSRDFLLRFQPIALAMQKCINFRPHIFIIDGVKSECTGQSSYPDSRSGGDSPASNPDFTGSCYNLCTNGGRYCAADPDDDLDSGISGADVVKEALRQSCIWSQDMYEEDGYNCFDGYNCETFITFSTGIKWWKYVNEFYEKCTVENGLFNDNACIERAYSAAGISRTEVAQCMLDSGGVAKNSNNNKLSTELEVQKSQGIFRVPTMHVNHVPYDGPMTVNSVFKSVCTQCNDFESTMLCRNCASCHDTSACVSNGSSCPPYINKEPLPPSVISTSPNTQSTSSGGATATSSSAFIATPVQANASSQDGVSTVTFVSSILMISLLAVMVAFWHYKRTRDEAREHVRSIMADYMPLHDDGTAISRRSAGDEMAAFYPNDGVGGESA